jgi:glycosyltransferase involved in cell wall biosynthesis
MKVMILGPLNSIHIQRWVEALSKREHKITIVSQDRAVDWICPEDVDLRYLPHSGNLGYFLNAVALRRILQDTQCDILNVHYASGYGTIAGIVGFTPTLLSVWGSDVYDFPDESALKRRLVTWNLRRATYIASTSEAMARQVKRLAPEMSLPFVTPFGVNTRQFAPATMEHEQSDKIVIGTVKTLAYKYGTDLLIRAFAQLLMDEELLTSGLSRKLHLRIVGTGPERLSLEALAVEEGLADRIEFVGAVAHSLVPEMLRGLDVYVAASRLDSESFGVAVVEASACGIPVVVTDVDGLSEVVEQGRTGIVVPREDVSALVLALKSLILNASLRRRLGKSGRASVQRRYDWEASVTTMIGCYERVRSMAIHA